MAAIYHTKLQDDNVVSIICVLYCTCMYAILDEVTDKTYLDDI